MEADSVGLEISVEINSEELKKLKAEPLHGILNFRDDYASPPLKRNIPIIIQYAPKQREFLIAGEEPKNIYLGETDIVKFSINPEFYSLLYDNKKFEQRFWMSGKLEILINDTEVPQTL